MLQHCLQAGKVATLTWIKGVVHFRWQATTYGIELMNPTMIQRHLWKSLGIALPLLLAASLHAADLTNLRCEYRNNPLGIDVPQPRLTWVIESTRRDEVQTAYQVLVASTPEKLAKDQGDLWDSGKVASDQSIQLEYAGKPLESRAACFWKVRVWGTDGIPSSWSRPAMWTMGLLRDEDWHATWIGARTTDLPDPTVLGYATEAQQAEEIKWVQLDLGAVKRIERVVLHPMRHEDPAAGGWINGYAFPLRFRLDVSDDADFHSLTTITDRTKADYTNPALTPITFDAGGKTARYVRLTATRLWHRGPNLPYCFTLAEMQVFCGEENVAFHAQVSAKDSVEAFGWAKSHLTDGLRVCPPSSDAAKPEEYPHAAILLRKEATLRQPVKRAVAYMSGLGWSELYINGKKVGDQVLSPAFTDYTKRVEYVVHDVSGLLAGG